LKRGKLLIGLAVVAFSVVMLALGAVSISKVTRANAMHDQAIRQMHTGNYEGACASFDKALDLRPDEPTFLANNGLCQEMLEDYDGAIESYRASLNLLEDAEVLFKLGRAICLAGDPERGVQTMWQAHSLVMVSPRQAGDLGLCLEQSGRPDQALPYLEQGLTAEPNNPVWAEALTNARGYQPLGTATQ